MRKYLAEFIGTFILVLIGTGAVIVNQETGGSLGLVGISFAWGFIVSVLIYVFGPTSGTHINPAVTISLALGNLMPKKEVFGYILAQVLGAILASVTLKFLFPLNTSLGGTLPSGSIAQSFIMEVLMTFLLLLTVMGVTAKKEFENLAGILIGLVIIAIILFAGPISGASINPARSIGPAIVSGNLTHIWIYLTAPTLGAILAVFFWKYFHVEEVA